MEDYRLTLKLTVVLLLSSPKALTGKGPWQTRLLVCLNSKFFSGLIWELMVRVDSWDDLCPAYNALSPTDLGGIIPDILPTAS